MVTKRVKAMTSQVNWRSLMSVLRIGGGLGKHLIQKVERIWQSPQTGNSRRIFAPPAGNSPQEESRSRENLEERRQPMTIEVERVMVGGTSSNDWVVLPIREIHSYTLIRTGPDNHPRFLVTDQFMRTENTIHSVGENVDEYI